ncbi:guanine nucleotide exchange factor DBS-like protein [Labeo rohita]|uniref:Guanine nucleotide exchange factor DBS-like protein n=1 Tax=Labeo rohita TaxID=84645 RepID=A0A498P6I9_LABRO|nr:guanine nucleotide exchange factor DBS-like protein [Labeo rohita]
MGFGGESSFLMICDHLILWFVQEIDSFVQEFLLVVNRLPSCISTLQSLSKRPVPADLERLREFCCVNEARFQQLRRYWLG